MIRGTVFAVLLVSLPATPSMADTWCVPNGEIGGMCPKVSPTIQGAIDQGRKGDVIRVGPGNPRERILVTKRVQIVGLPGHLITDAGLGPGAALLTFSAAPIANPIFERLVLEVVTSDAGVVVPSTVTTAVFRGVQISSTVTDPRPAFGFRADKSKRTYFIGASGTTPRVSGFEVGIDLNAITWHDVEAGTVIENNGIGLRVEHGKGQIFWNTFRNNDVALEVRGAFHTDINSNTFTDNGLAVFWGLATTRHPDSKRTSQKTIEFNHPVLERNAENFRIEVSPGNFSGDYRQDPGCNVQWTNMLVDGKRLPNHLTPSC